VDNPDAEEVRRGRPTVYDTWLERNRSPDDKQRPKIPVVGSGSDFAAFVCRLGVSSIDLRFTFDPSLNISSYPIYHSAYETSYYYETFIDPGFKVSLYTSLSGLCILPRAQRGWYCFRQCPFVCLFVCLSVCLSLSTR